MVGKRVVFALALIAVDPTGVPPAAALAAPAAVTAAAPAVTAAAPAVTAAAPAAGRAASALPAMVYTGGGDLNLRTGPSTANRVVGSVANGTRVGVACQVYGQHITGPRRSPFWDRLSNGRYVSDAYLRWPSVRPPVRWCGASGEPVAVSVASAGGAVNTRTGPGTAYRLTGRLANGSPLVVLCQRWGERIGGPRITTSAWNLLPGGRYLSDALVAWQPSRPLLPWCGEAPPTVPAATPAGFIARVAGPARLGTRRYRVPASVTIAQAILESGWGRSALTRRDHNYFGIKCFGGPGPIAIGCRGYATFECGGGGCWRTRAAFRVYRDAAGSMADHGRFLVVNPRYRAAFRYTRDPNRFAVAIHRAGYATSPTYARNLIGIMRRYDLYRYDR